MYLSLQESQIRHWDELGDLKRHIQQMSKYEHEVCPRAVEKRFHVF